MLVDSLTRTLGNRDGADDIPSMFRDRSFVAHCWPDPFTTGATGAHRCLKDSGCPPTSGHTAGGSLPGHDVSRYSASSTLRPCLLRAYQQFRPGRSKYSMSAPGYSARTIASVSQAARAVRIGEVPRTAPRITAMTIRVFVMAAYAQENVALLDPEQPTPWGIGHAMRPCCTPSTTVLSGAGNNRRGPCCRGRAYPALASRPRAGGATHRDGLGCRNGVASAGRLHRGLGGNDPAPGGCPAGGDR